MLALKESSVELSVSPPDQIQNLSRESTIKELLLYDFQIETSHPAKEVAQTFQTNPLLPGVILIEQGEFGGMISRRHFLEQMSRPYGLELFLKRPLYSLYRFVSADILKLPGEMLIVEAARRSLKRPAQMLYEPIVVEIEAGVYRILDVHQLLVAQSHIHALTTRLLDEQTHAQMVQTEKMASLGQMIASIAHEIKNPVGCITCNFDFLTSYCQKLIQILSVYELEVSDISDSLAQLKQECDLDFIIGDLPKILQSMQTGADRLTKIVGGLQYFSHLNESKRQLADIHECIENTLVILNNRLHKAGIQVIKNYGEVPLVNCYSGQLNQVFMNIISNAIDALVDKLGDPAAASKSWQPQILISTDLLEQTDRDRISVCIADNGFGIPPEIQSHIFETFFTTKPIGKGTGLGLAISHQIITKKHGGELMMSSLPEVGTEFKILLPLD